VLRFLCHCTICQAFNNSAQADICVYTNGQVRLPDDHPVDFQTYRRPPAVDRGKCRACGQPAIEYFRLPLLPDIVFVPSANHPDPAALPAPAMRMFYNSRVADAEDDLPRHEGYWPSQLAFLRGYLAGLIRRKAPDPRRLVTSAAAVLAGTAIFETELG
jgi:hypothetical protein